MFAFHELVQRISLPALELRNQVVEFGQVIFRFIVTLVVVHSIVELLICLFQSNELTLVIHRQPCVVIRHLFANCVVPRSRRIHLVELRLRRCHIDLAVVKLCHWDEGGTAGVVLQHVVHEPVSFDRVLSVLVLNLSLHPVQSFNRFFSCMARGPEVMLQ